MRGLVGVDGGDGEVLRRVDDELRSVERGMNDVSETASKLRVGEATHREMQMALRHVLSVTRPNCCCWTSALSALRAPDEPPITCTQTGADNLAIHE